ncbi:MAG: cytidylate kinase family protein, partial [Lachnospiraceae bacterium]
MAKVITISREYGAGGRTIGEKVADRLGLEYLDKAI